MIELTPVAAEKLQAIRTEHRPTAYLRVYVAGRSCCGYQYGLSFDDEVAADDAVSEEAGIPVAIDALSRPYCEGATVDYVDDPSGSGFVVRNPSVGGSCACGH